MKNFWNKPWVISIISLFLAILIVVYIDETQTGFWTQGESSQTRQTATETQSIRVPLQVSVDTNQYYVVGYPEKVKVTLEGSRALVTSTVNTQNFRAYVDLTNFGVGEHTAKIKISGLSNQISYKITPATVKVNIQRRKTRTLPVQIEYNGSAVAKSYHVDKTLVNPTQVQVTGARSEVDQIDQIVAKVVLPNGINRDYERQVMLVAKDKHGRQLNVVIDPSTAHVTIPISISKKTVKLNLNASNEASGYVYSVTAKQNNIVIYGDTEDLKKISHINLAVDLRKSRESFNQSYKIKLPKGLIKAEPASVEVEVTAREVKNDK